MVDLTRKEIYTQLKRLGVNSSSDLKKYLKEYRTYITPSNDLPRQEVLLAKCKKIFFILRKTNYKRQFSIHQKK
ncbi:MAG: hypothetical protein ACW980_22820 [Promethearchaeota archaeon]|jgi:hypothetical protein